MNPEELVIQKVNKKRAWCYCPKHLDKYTPNLEICLQGKYRGKCYCWACGYSDFIEEDKLKKIFGEEKSIVKKPLINWFNLANSYLGKSVNQIETLCNNWKISLSSLSHFLVGWNEAAYTIPMVNENCMTIGIQLRYPDGFKCCVEGSQLGLFIPFLYQQRLDEILYICEGFSDTVTVYDLGFFAIGRPNALSCMEIIEKFIELNNIKEIVIVADNDRAGRDGANKLWDYLKVVKPSSKCIITPDLHKDIRETYLERGRKFTRKCLTFS